MMLWRCRKVEGEMSAEEAAGVCGDSSCGLLRSRCCRPPWLIAVLSSSTHNALLNLETLRLRVHSSYPSPVGTAPRVTLLNGVEA